MKDGFLSFLPVRIGQKSSVGPYAVIQKGTVLGAEADVLPLQKTEVGKNVFKTREAPKVQKVCMDELVTNLIPVSSVTFA